MSKNRRSLQLTLSFVSAIVCWFWVKLSQDNHQATILYPYKFIALPDDVQLSDIEPPRLKLVLSGRGGYLLLENWASSRDTLTFPYDKIKTVKRISSLALKEDIHKHFLGSRLSLATLEERDIWFNKQVRRSKKVPLRFNAKIELAATYQIEGTPILTPDSVTIIGPEDRLTHIAEWYTDSIKIFPQKLEGINNVYISPKKDKGIIVRPSSLELSFLPREYTQYTFTVPIEIYNQPENVEIKLGVHQVSVTGLVPMREYDRFTSRDYKLRIDFNSLDPDIPWYPPDLSFFPSAVKVVTCTPAEISYIIVKNKEAVQ